MNSIFSKPYLFFWLLCPSAILISLFFDDQALDLQFHDTYYVMAYTHIGLFVALIFLMIGLIYWFARNIRLNEILVKLHLVLTLLSLLLIGLCHYTNSSYIDFYSARMEPQRLISIIGLLIFISGQFLFLLNLMIGLRSVIKK